MHPGYFAGLASRLTLEFALEIYLILGVRLRLQQRSLH